MILTAHQSQFFAGYPGYLSKIDEADLYVYMDLVDYSHNDFINRNRIRTKEGWQWLTVPVKHKGETKKINEIEIDNTKPWRKKHIKSIEQCYSRAPHFQKYIKPIKAIYEKEWQYLSEFNLFCLVTVLKELQIDTPMIRMSANSFKGEKSELILDMCLQTGADWFIFGTNGKDYVKPKLFYDCGIEIEFQEYQQISYKQCYNGWEPYMGTIDLLFNCGPDSLDVIRGKQ